MSLLHTITERVEDCIVAAWVDLRTGTVIDHHPAHGDAVIAPSLDAAIEVMRSRERPPRMVLLSERHVHLIHCTAADPQRALVVICGRSPNLGLSVSLVRALMESEAA
jgi:hypothetical protein